MDEVPRPFGRPTPPIWTTYLVQMGGSIDEFGGVIHTGLPQGGASKESKRPIHQRPYTTGVDPEGLYRGCRKAGLVFDLYQGPDWVVQNTSQVDRNGKIRPIAQNQTGTAHEARRGWLGES